MFVTLIIQQAKLTAIFTQNLRLQCKSRHVQTLHMPRPTLQSQILPQSNLRNYTLCIYVLTFFGRESNIYYTTSSMHTCINGGTGGSSPLSIRSPTPDPSGGRSKLGEKPCENLAPSPGVSTLMHVYACMSSTFYQNNMPCVPCQISRVWLIQKTHFPPLHITYIHTYSTLMYSYTITCKATLILAMAYIIILCRPIWSIYGLSRQGIKLTFYHSTRCNSRTTVITEVDNDFLGKIASLFLEVEIMQYQQSY